MFTAARLVAAILFAGLGYVSAGYVTDTFPDGQSHTYFEPIVAAIGLWQGWMVMGLLVGRGWGGALGNGLRTAVQVIFFALVFFALRTMFARSADLRYNDFGVAVMDALNLFMEYGADLSEISPAWGLMIVGGIIAGGLTELASRLWR